jgi:hypothetical protein
MGAARPLPLGGRRFADLCRDVYVLAQYVDLTAGPRRGWRWEQRIADTLARRGFPATTGSSGVEVRGLLAASGLRHQMDATIECSDVYVVGEWKAYTKAVPKNELLRFKAATDDFYDAIVEYGVPKRPIVRLFGIAGDACPSLRGYAARHGIALIERSRWPSPVLADPLLRWPPGEGPSGIDVQRLAWLARPLQTVYPQLPDGSLQIPPQLPTPALEAILAVQDQWSTRLWDWVDSQPGTFEQYGLQLSA